MRIQIRIRIWIRITIVTTIAILKAEDRESRQDQDRQAME